MFTVSRVERGWAGHLCVSHHCRFRRNTLLEAGGRKIVVSTVGAYINPQKEEFEEIGCDRHYETMAFVAKQEGEYIEGAVELQVNFDSKAAITLAEIGANPDGIDNVANAMHEAVVDEISGKLARNEKISISGGNWFHPSPIAPPPNPDVTADLSLTFTAPKEGHNDSFQS